MAGDGWFAGAEVRGAHAVAFLARLRLLLDAAPAPTAARQES